MNIATLKPRHHEPPGWDVQIFERVTDALAAALVAAYKRQTAEERREDCDT